MEEIDITSYFKSEDGYYYYHLNKNIRFIHLTSIKDYPYNMEVFCKKYFFGLIGRKKWRSVCLTSNLQNGLCYIINSYQQKFIKPPIIIL
jgi:hypothetical protein